MIESDQNKINTILKSIEEERLEYVKALDREEEKVEKENASKTLIKIILVLLTIILSFFFPKWMVFFAMIAIFIAGFILAPGIYTPDATKLNMYHRIAMERLLSVIYPQIIYKGAWPVFKKDVEQSLLLTGSVFGTDHLTGTTSKGYHFECAEIEETFDGRGWFRGIFFKIENPVFFAKPIVIRPKLKNVPLGYLAGFKQLVIKDIDPVFESRYDIYVQDIMEARTILTAEFLEPLVQLSKQYLDVRWSFIGSQIYFAASIKTGLFSLLNVRYDVLVPSVLEKFNEDVKLCINMAEELSQQLENTSERVKIDLKNKQKMKDLDDPYNHLVGD